MESTSTTSIRIIATVLRQRSRVKNLNTETDDISTRKEENSCSWNEPGQESEGERKAKTAFCCSFPTISSRACLFSVLKPHITLTVGAILKCQKARVTTKLSRAPKNQEESRKTPPWGNTLTPTPWEGLLWFYIVLRISLTFDIEDGIPSVDKRSKYMNGSCHLAYSGKYVATGATHL